MNDGEQIDSMFDLLGDRYARGILRSTSSEPKGVREISRELDVARSTIYRRVDELVEYGLLHERTKPAEDGNHFAVYETVIERLTVEIEDGEIDCELQQSDDASTRLGKLLQGMRES